MKSCRHQELVLLNKGGEKVRCRRCHLTIDAKDLGAYCPECWEVHGVRHREFEKIQAQDNQSVLYRCEQCGDMIEVR